jgi:hypothetical protein
MADIVVKLAPDEIMSDFYFTKNPISIAKKNLPSYKEVAVIAIENVSGKNAADEMFDLTNNPGRQAEREKCYGRLRSISVGDIVNVDGTDYLCDKFGWIKV